MTAPPCSSEGNLQRSGRRGPRGGRRGQGAFAPAWLHWVSSTEREIIGNEPSFHNTLEKNFCLWFSPTLSNLQNKNLNDWFSFHRNDLKRQVGSV